MPPPQAIAVPQATISQPGPQALVLSGSWTARAMGSIAGQLAALQMGGEATLARNKYAAEGGPITADGTQIDALDTAGAWVLQTLLLRLQGQGPAVTLNGFRPQFEHLLAVVAGHMAEQARQPAAPAQPHQNLLERLGRNTHDTWQKTAALLAFIGEAAATFATSALHPSKFRVRPILFNVRTAGFDALPIVGLLSFLMGIVVAYQAADQLRQFGANIFVVDLVGLSVLREFAPLMTAIIIAGRSGSAYAAQIGTMTVTEEIDAMRTIGIEPMELLVLPKIIALMLALPLLTVFADILGLFGGMLMARAQLGVTYTEFLDRLVRAVDVTDYLIGVGKAPVFAAIITIVGCFQGFRTKGGADSVGRQTTRSVVQSIFLVIVADALFSIVFSALNL
jgi:phospholipid/cholesterol/gamma-HCH transport system permease protein